MFKSLFILILIIAAFNIELRGQSLIVEVGLSKHFIPEADEYEQPNLQIQLQHRFFEKFEYHLNYYSIKTYWPYVEHTITPWLGDEKEIYTRFIKGLDLNLNLFAFFYPKSNLGFSVGPTFRKRSETGFELCQITLGGWMECFGYSEEFYDSGLNLELNYNYFIWQKLGAEISIMERFYNSGPSSFSINGGVIYKFGK